MAVRVVTDSDYGDAAGTGVRGAGIGVVTDEAILLYARQVRRHRWAEGLDGS